MSTAASFRPPKVAAAEAAFTNAVRGKRRRLAVELGGVSWQVRLPPPGPMRAGPALRLSDGAAQAWVRLADWNGLPQLAELAGGAFDALPSDIQAVVAEVAFAPALDALGTATGTAWRIDEVGPWPNDAAQTVGVELQDGSGALKRGELALDAAAAETFAKLVGRAPPAPWRDLDAVPLPVHVLIGETRLKRGDLVSLRAGDVLVVERLFTAANEADQPGSSAVATVGAKLAFEATLGSAGAVLRGPTVVPAAPEPDAVRIEIAGASITLAAAKALKAGATLALAGGREDVRLSQGDRVVGGGGLVLVAGQLGVRLRVAAE